MLAFCVPLSPTLDEFMGDGEADEEGGGSDDDDDDDDDE